MWQQQMISGTLCYGCVGGLEGGAPGGARGSIARTVLEDRLECVQALLQPPLKRRQLLRSGLLHG
eukprot:COSAG01_NODE_2364_length_7819_cov_14.933549_8_plen_64_part_01